MGFEVLRTLDSSNSGTYRDHARGLAERTCGHCTHPQMADGRAVNLSCYSGEALGSSPACLSIAGALNFVEGKRNVVGVPLDANPSSSCCPGKPENLVVRSSGRLSRLCPDVLNFVYLIGLVHESTHSNVIYDAQG